MVEQTDTDARLADFIWKNAENLWGDFNCMGFDKIILPFTLLRRLVRLKCVFGPINTLASGQQSRSKVISA